MKTSPHLERYRGLVDESLLTAIYDVASSLHGLRVLHLNTTDQGGGVAEILLELLPVMEELGIRHGWKIIQLDEASGYFSARHESVRKRFLFPTLILGYLQALRQAYTKSSKRSEYEVVCRDSTVADVEIAA